MEEYVNLHTADNVTHIVINRPAVKNALNSSAVLDLTRAFRSASADKNCNCVLFYGQGQEAFCSGADLKELQAATSLSQRKQFFSGIAGLISAMHGCKKPVVAKVHGFALAGGCGLVAASDIVYAEENASFGLPEVKIGLVPMIVMAAIERVCGKRALAHMALSGDNIGAQEALRINLISKVVPKAGLDGEALSAAVKIAGKSPLMSQVIRERLYQTPKSDFTSNVRDLSDLISILSLSEDSSEGIRAFNEKRKPVWKGK